LYRGVTIVTVTRHAWPALSICIALHLQQQLLLSAPVVFLSRLPCAAGHQDYLEGFEADTLGLECLLNCDVYRQGLGGLACFLLIVPAL